MEKSHAQPIERAADARHERLAQLRHQLDDSNRREVIRFTQIISGKRARSVKHAAREVYGKGGMDQTAARFLQAVLRALE